MQINEMTTGLMLETERKFRCYVGSKSASPASCWWRVAMVIKCQLVLRHLKERKASEKFNNQISTPANVEFIQGEMSDSFQIISQQISIFPLMQESQTVSNIG